MEIKTQGIHLGHSSTDLRAHPLTHTAPHIIYYFLPLQPTSMGAKTHAEAWLFNYTTNQMGGVGWTEYNLKHEKRTEAMADLFCKKTAGSRRAEIRRKLEWNLGGEDVTLITQPQGRVGGAGGQWITQYFVQLNKYLCLQSAGRNTAQINHISHQAPAWVRCK